MKKLVDFTKIHLEAGEDGMVTFCVPYEKLGYYDMNMKFIMEDGDFEIFTGKNSVDCLSKVITLTF